MPPLNLDFLLLLKDDYTKYTAFIETGTYHGATIFTLEPYFQKVYTIEISPKYHNTTKQRYFGNKINFILGDSSKVLPDILSKIDDRCIFFLDGHWSADDTGKGDKDCPLMEEIANIHTYCKNDAIIIIDDFRLFGKGPNQTGDKYDVCNWENIDKDSLLSIIQPRITHMYHLDSNWAKNDRLIVHIKAL